MKEILKNLSNEELDNVMCFYLGMSFTAEKVAKQEISNNGLLLIAKSIFKTCKDEYYSRNRIDEFQQLLDEVIKGIEENFGLIVDKANELRDFLDSLE